MQVRNELAPEVKVDTTKVDIYAIGVLLYRMLTTKMPFTGITEKGVTTAILNKIPEQVRTSNSKVPLGLDELIISCMAKRPEARPATRQLIKELGQYSTEHVVIVPQGKGLFGKFG